MLCDSSEKPCCTCNTCRRVLNKTHPDVSYVLPDENKKTGVTGVDSVREITKEASVFPVETRYKVFVFTNAETLTVQAQNALLKLLEDPPETARFILLCENHNTLLETVISRCVVYKTEIFDENVVYNYLRDNYKQENEKIKNAAKRSFGNIGLAISLLNKNKSKLETVCENFLFAISKRDEHEALSSLAVVEKLERADYKEFLGLVTESIRDALVLGSKTGRFTGDDELSKTFSENFSQQDLIKVIGIAENHIMSQNVNVNIAASAWALYVELKEILT